MHETGGVHKVHSCDADAPGSLASQCMPPMHSSAGAEAGKKGGQEETDQAGSEGGHQGHSQAHQGVRSCESLRPPPLPSVRCPYSRLPLACLRPGACSVCIIAGDISPIDVITPLPVLCEDNDVPYIYVPSKEELGQAGLTKRPTSCMLILPKPLKGELPSDEEGKEYAEAYEEVYKKVKAAQVVF